MNKIIVAKSPAGNPVLIFTDGQGNLVYRQLNGEPYTGSCDDLTYECCSGKSPYDLAVENGFTGTEQEWLNSLRGADGQNGINGVDGVDGTDGVDGIDGITPQPIWNGTELSWDLTGDGNSDTTPVDLQSDICSYLASNLSFNVNGNNLELVCGGTVVSQVDTSTFGTNTSNPTVSTFPLTSNGVVGTPFTVNYAPSVTANTDCQPVSYAVSNTVNCSVVNNNDGTFEVTITTAGSYSFDVTVTCSDNTTSSTGQIAGTGTPSSNPTINITGQSNLDVTSLNPTLDLSSNVTANTDCEPVIFSVANEVNVTVVQPIADISAVELQIVPGSTGYSFNLIGTCSDGTTTDLGKFDGDVNVTPTGNDLDLRVTSQGNPPVIAGQPDRVPAGSIFQVAVATQETATDFQGVTVVFNVPSGFQIQTGTSSSGIVAINSPTQAVISIGTASSDTTIFDIVASSTAGVFDLTAVSSTLSPNTVGNPVIDQIEVV